MLDTRIKSALELVTTATLTTVLLKKGLRNVWLRGARPLTPQDRRIVGEAFTLRFVPAREDLATPASWASPKSTRGARSEEHTSELQSLMRISYAVFCLKKKKTTKAQTKTDTKE